MVVFLRSSHTAFIHCVYKIRVWCAYCKACGPTSSAFLYSISSLYGASLVCRIYSSRSTWKNVTIETYQNVIKCTNNVSSCRYLWFCSNWRYRPTIQFAYGVKNDVLLKLYLNYKLIYFMHYNHNLTFM